MAMNENLEIKTRFSAEEFPLKLMNVKSQGTVRLHRHEFQELVVVHSGYGIHLLDNEKYAIGAGDVFLLTENHVHGYERTESLALTNVLFLPQRLFFLRGDVASLPGCHALLHLEPRYRKKHAFMSRLRLDIAGLQPVTSILNELAEELSTCRGGYQTMAIAAFMRLITELSRAYENFDLGVGQEVLVLGKVLSSMDRNYSKQWNLDELAGTANMSRRNFQRVFREAMGQTPMQYLIGIRIANACERLAHEGITVKEISSICGYAEVNYFVRQFRQQIGLTPGQYRETILQKAHYEKNRELCNKKIRASEI
jgi:AraC-like DNA-binding protein/quercetin dioxygenase-like cupin family protein